MVVTMLNAKTENIVRSYKQLDFLSFSRIIRIRLTHDQVAVGE